MKAAILTQFKGRFEVVDDAEIDDPGVGEVLVRVRHCGVCHSDYAAWEFGAQAGYLLPAILGHEAAGVIVKVGSGVTDRTVGQHVILSMKSPCGNCFQCTRGNFMVCEKPPGTDRRGSRVRWKGRPLMRGFGVGAFAEYVLADVNGAIPIDEADPLDVAAVVGCAVQTGVGAVRNIANVSAGDSVVVIGAGSVGISVVQGARLAGAALIAIVDPKSDRREQALALGATHAFDSVSSTIAQDVIALTGGRGADCAFDLMSLGSTVELALASIRPAGRLVLIGVPGAAGVAQLSTSPLVMSQKQIVGCMLGNCHPQRDLPLFMELWSQGKLEIDRLITARRPLDQINEAFADLSSGIGLRTVLTI